MPFGRSIRTCPVPIPSGDYQKGRWHRGEGIRIDHLMLSPSAADRLIDAGIDKEHTRQGKGQRSHAGLVRVGGCATAAAPDALGCERRSPMPLLPVHSDQMLRHITAPYLTWGFILVCVAAHVALSEIPTYEHSTALRSLGFIRALCLVRPRSRLCLSACPRY